MSTEQALRDWMYEQAARSILSGRVTTWTPTPELCAAFRRLADRVEGQQ